MRFFLRLLFGVGILLLLTWVLSRLDSLLGFLFFIGGSLLIHWILSWSNPPSAHQTQQATDFQLHRYLRRLQQAAKRAKMAREARQIQQTTDPHVYRPSISIANLSDALGQDGPNTVLVDGGNFVAYAGQSSEKWTVLEGTRLLHRDLGNGIVQQIAPRGGYPLVYVRFEGSNKNTQFNTESFKMGLIHLWIPRHRIPSSLWPDCSAWNAAPESERQALEATELSGLHDAFTGAPLNVALGLYRCSVCQVYYHTESFDVLTKENGGQCVACSSTEIEIYVEKAHRLPKPQWVNLRSPG